MRRMKMIWRGVFPASDCNYPRPDFQMAEVVRITSASYAQPEAEKEILVPPL